VPETLALCHKPPATKEGLKVMKHRIALVGLTSLSTLAAIGIFGSSAASAGHLLFGDRTFMCALAPGEFL
jgi:hypothetical protein